MASFAFLLFVTGGPVMADHSTEVRATEVRAAIDPLVEHRRFDAAADAEAYAERICGALLSMDEVPNQMPFHATDEGATWRVVGSRRADWPRSFIGPLTVIIEKATGKILDAHFVSAPAEWVADRMRQAEPPDGGKRPVWTPATIYEEHRSFDTAAEAEAYAERLCSAAYSDRDETPHQLPFQATLEGDNWRVVGSRPYGWPKSPLTGPLTIVFVKATGQTLDVHFTAAPKGWDADILRKLGRDPYPDATK